jgi:hypothetical protein
MDVYDRTILELRNTCSTDFCKDVIDRFEKDSRKHRGLTADGVKLNVKVSTDLAFRRDDYKFGDICDKICKDIFGLGLVKYMKRISKIDRSRETGSRGCISEWIIDQVHITCPVIQRTDEGGFFDWHTDYSPGQNRILGGILYLNDVKEEDGGSTEFNSGRKIQPEAGKLIIFPSDLTHLHRGNVLKHGSKYIATVFFHIPSPSRTNPSPFIPPFTFS